MTSSILLTSLVVLTTGIAQAQTPYAVTGTQPSHMTAGVDLQTTVRISFNQPIPAHLTSVDLMEMVDVSPRSDIQIHSFEVTEDRRGLLASVTHIADREYHWTVTGPLPIDRFHLLSYSTAASFAHGSVSGIISLPQGASQASHAFGFVFLTPDPSLTIWEDVPRFAGIATIASDGSFTIPGVRSGTYHAYALITANPMDEESDEVYFGSHASALTVNGAPIPGATVVMQPLYSFLPVYHSHAKLAEVRASIAAAYPNAGLKSMMGFQSLLNGVMPDGSSSMWISLWHDAPLGTSLSAIASGGFTDIEPIENEGLASVPTLPDDLISSRQAVAAAMTAGGSQFLSRLPSNAVTFVSYGAGSDPVEFGYEGVVLPGPYWFIRMTTSYTQGNEQIDEMYFALVHGQSGEVIDQTPTSIDRTPADVQPEAIRLSQNYPNPFNPTTLIGFRLPVSSEVRLNVYDILGREVAVLVDGVMPAGEHQVSFDATGLSSGVYLYRLQSGYSVETRRMTLVK